jgi:hypothetical protein
MEQPAEKASRAPNTPMASALALLIALAIPFSLLAFNLYRVLFDPSRVKALIADEAINSDLVPIALEWFSDRQASGQAENGAPLGNLDKPNIALLIPHLDRRAWRAISNELLTEAFVVDAVSTVVDGIYSWIEGNDPVPRIVLDLEPLQNRVMGDSGLSAAIVAFDNLPDCSEEQVSETYESASAAQPSPELLSELCKLPDPWQEQQITGFVGAFVKAISDLPGQFAFGDRLSQLVEEEGVELGSIKQQLRVLRNIGRVSLLLPLVLLALITVLFFRSPWSLGLWIGAPLILGGFLAMIWALSSGWMITNILAAGVLRQAADGIRTMSISLVDRAAGEAFGPMAIQALVIILLGIGLVALYFIHRHRAQP